MRVSSSRLVGGVMIFRANTTASAAAVSAPSATAPPTPSAMVPTTRAAEPG
jgi:hypothetical protein